MATTPDKIPNLFIEAYRTKLSFISYLTDSEISYEMKDQQLPFVPLSFNNDSMATRVMEKAKFAFDVYAETRTNCIENYLNLQHLLNMIKPSYFLKNDQWVPSANNTTGFFKLQFAGMPLIDRKEVTLHLTAFNYNINKDTGYISVNRQELSNATSPGINTGTLKITTSDDTLVPVSYKISIEGKVLLPFGETKYNPDYKKSK